MDFTSNLPSRPGLYLVDRPGQDRTVCNVWVDPDTELTMVSFAGRARGRTLDSVDSVFPGIKFAPRPIDILQDKTDGRHEFSTGPKSVATQYDSKDTSEDDPEEQDDI